MLLVSTAAFLSVQLIVFLFIKILNIPTLNKIIVGIGDLIFIIALFFYPITNTFHYIHLGVVEGPRCGAPMIGPIFFQWLMGIPLVIIVHRLSNKYLFNAKIDDVT